MKARGLVQLFFKTLLLGGVSTLIIGVVLKWDQYGTFFMDFNVKEMAMTIIWLMGMGFLFSLTSQMGFFAYLTIHRFGLGVFRSVRLWNIVQVFLVIVALGDFIYFQTFSASGDQGLGFHVTIASVLMLSALGVAYVKAKQTNKQAFIPAVFFMVVATLIELLPAINTSDSGWLPLMLATLLLCNGYQLLILHKLLEQAELESKAKKAS